MCLIDRTGDMVKESNKEIFLGKIRYWPQLFQNFLVRIISPSSEIVSTK